MTPPLHLPDHLPHLLRSRGTGVAASLTHTAAPDDRSPAAAATGGLSRRGLLLAAAGATFAGAAMTSLAGAGAALAADADSATSGKLSDVLAEAKPASATPWRT